MLAVCLAAVGLRFGTWGAKHAVTLDGVIIFTLAGAIAMTITYFATNDSSSHPASNSAGRDNNGLQIGGSVIGSDALKEILKSASPSVTSITNDRLYIHHAEYISTKDPSRRCDVTDCLRELVVDNRLVLEIYNHSFITRTGKNCVPEDPHPQETKKLVVTYSFDNGPLCVLERMEREKLELPGISAPAKHQLPRISLSLSKDGTVQVFDTHIDFAKAGGKRCDVIVVHSQPGRDGEEAPVARRISARLTFSPSGSSRATFVDRACWVGKMENEISLHPGDTEYILLRIAGDEEWITYSNPNRYNSGEWPNRNQDLEEVRFSICANLKLSGEVSIIAHQNDKALTLKTCKFTGEVDASGLFVKIRLEDGSRA